jgi:chemotaxis protein MotA
MMAKRRGGSRLDMGSVVGLLLAVVGIMGGFWLENGRPHQMLGLSAALIVFGGCFGATLVANSPGLVRGAAARLRDVFLETESNHAESIDEIVAYATKARKNGLVSLEKEAMAIPDSFLRKSLMLAIDGADLQELRSMMELEIDLAEQKMEREAGVYESAGGYAPTIGIVGAVLGLILVMEDITDINKVGHGIAAAFVATIYGVGVANLFLLPAAHKIKLRAQAARERRELVLEGVTAIVEGLNPKLIRLKLEAFVAEQERPSPAKRKAA